MVLQSELFFSIASSRSFFVISHGLFVLAALDPNVKGLYLVSKKEVPHSSLSEGHNTLVCTI
jgi:hypothetical protein